MEENRFLTEFDKVPFVRKFILSLNGFGLALFFFCFALVNSFLAYVSGAHCFWLKASSPDNQPQVILMGYWGELNAAPLYVFVVPVLIFLFCRFLIFLHESFASLEESGILRSNLPNASVLDTLGRRNKKLFQIVAATAVVLAFSNVFVIEGLTFLQTKEKLKADDPKEVVMGYVQRPYFEDWTKKVSESETLRDQIPELKNKQNLKIESKPAEQFSNFILFAVFLFPALLLQALLIFLLLWVSVKILYFLWETWGFLPKVGLDPDGTYARFHPDFGDEKRRYGLSELDFIYRQILWLLVFAGVALIANFSTNDAKGTFGNLSGEEINWLIVLGRAAIFLIPTVIFIVFVFFPLLIYRNSMERVKEQALRVLNGKIKDKAVRMEEIEATQIASISARKKKESDKETKNLQEEIKELRQKKDILLEQITYPRGDKLFFAQIILLIVLLFFIPVTLVADVTINLGDTYFDKISRVVKGTVESTRTLLKVACGCSKNS